MSRRYEVEMAWIVLIFAGLLETAWAGTLKLATARPSVWLIGLAALCIISSLVALYWSMARLPLGVAYPIWTGVGAIGSVCVSVILLHQRIGPMGILGLILLLVGMVLLAMDSPH